MSFRMVLKGEVKTQIKSKRVNEEKLSWFMYRIQRHKPLRKSDSFIKIYKSNRKTNEVFLTQQSVDSLSLEWINYKKKEN